MFRTGMEICYFATMGKILGIATFLALGKFSLRFMQPDFLYPVLRALSWCVGTVLQIPFQWVPGHGFANQGLHIVIDHSCSGSGFFMLLIAMGVWNSTIPNGWQLLKLLGWLIPLAFLLTMGVNIVRLILVLGLLIHIPSMQAHQSDLHLASGVFLFAGFLILYHMAWQSRLFSLSRKFA